MTEFFLAVREIQSRPASKRSRVNSRFATNLLAMLLTSLNSVSRVLLEAYLVSVL